MMDCSAPDTAIYKYWERHSFYGVNFLKPQYMSEVWILEESLESGW